MLELAIVLEAIGVAFIVLALALDEQDRPRPLKFR